MAEYEALASVDDVKAALGRDLTTSEQAQVGPALEKASELFRRAARRDFTAGRKTTRLKVNGGEVRLPQSPVATIHAVTDDDGNPVRWAHPFGATLTVAMRSHQFVRVDYSYGGDVPKLVRTTVADIVARLFNVDDRAKSGLAQYQKGTGPFTEGGTFASWAVGGQVMLSPADEAVAASFRAPRLANTVVL